MFGSMKRILDSSSLTLIKIKMKSCLVKVLVMVVSTSVMMNGEIISCWLRGPISTLSSASGGTLLHWSSCSLLEFTPQCDNENQLNSTRATVTRS
ncbi:unnamed protein product [Leptidea sinapis]|uniref:Uncharacterized protein n=1 Tax=Leptidea sinapis TaxID=189913 RepID=A0A5E4QQ35_9NEOP|nr:unnamed protein product [Leptidea sinapis]